MSLLFNPTTQLELTISCRKKSGPLSKFRLDLSPEMKEILDLLLKYSATFKAGQPVSNSLKPYLKYLAEFGLVLQKDMVPNPVKPGWWFDVDTLKFVPSVFRAEAKAAIEGGEKFEFNTGFVFLQNSVRRPLISIRGIPPSCDFPCGKRLLWVFDPGTQMWANYELSLKYFKLIKQVYKRRSLRHLAATDMELLIHSCVLVPVGYRKQREIVWNKHLLRQRCSLRAERFTIVRRMLTPLQIAIMRDRYRKLESEGYLEMDHSQVRNKRFCSHNETLLRFVHRQSGNMVRHLTGEAILPSYSFLSAYLQGAKLKRHIDRPQCQWNGSILIDALPEMSLDESWPMYLALHKRVAEVKLDFGDAVFYSGSEIPHWRNKITKGHRQTLGLLHYVPIDFMGSFD